MFHVKHIIKRPISLIVFAIFLIVLPFGTRIILNPSEAYIWDYFSYHLAFFLYLSDILLITTFLAWLLFDVKHLRETMFHNKIFLKISLFLILVLVSLFHVKHSDLGVYSAIKWLELWFLCFYLSWLNRGTLKLVMNILVIGGVFQAFLAILQFNVQAPIGLNILGEYISEIGANEKSIFP